MQSTITEVPALRRQGATRSEIRLATRDLARLCCGSYAAKPGTEEDEHVLRAVALVRRLHAVAASHTTAAIALGLPLRRDWLLTVDLSPLAGRRGHAKSGPGYRMHRRPLGPESLAPVGELMATDPVTTILDCARVLDEDWAVVLADAALHKGLVTVEQLRAESEKIHRLQGASRARALPGKASRKAESPGETLARLRLIRMGYSPDEQVVLGDVPGSPRVDLLLDGWLVVEFDGQAKYGLSSDPAEAYWREKQRHDRIVEAGYEVLHLTWADLWDEARLVERIARALRRSRLRMARTS